MATHQLTILRTYALKDPATLPSSILFNHSERTLTIYDAFPKAIFHFLVLPRISTSTVNVNQLTSLKTLLKGDKTRAKEVISALKQDSQSLRMEIEGEMLKRYGFKWNVWTGFHAAPSLPHLHLHVLSADMRSECMKNKKHYNSFHPKKGFFLDIDEVLSWFEAEESYFNTMAKLEPKSFEALLKEDLSCFYCHSPMSNMPTLKAHLQDEWDKQAVREKAKLERKRKVEERYAKNRDEVAAPSKKQKTGADAVSQ